MFTFLIILELLISVLLILVILMQSSKGGGLAGTFGGGSVGVVFGVRRTTDFLMRATQILAAAFLVIALVTNIFFLPRTTAEGESVLQRNAAPSATTPQLPPAPTQSPVSVPGQ